MVRPKDSQDDRQDEGFVCVRLTFSESVTSRAASQHKLSLLFLFQHAASVTQLLRMVKIHLANYAHLTEMLHINKTKLFLQHYLLYL